MSDRNQETEWSAPTQAQANEKPADPSSTISGYYGPPSIATSGADASNAAEAIEEPIYYIPMMRSLIRKLATLSSEADRKLRGAAPSAFIGNVVPLYETGPGHLPMFGIAFRSPDGRPAVRAEWTGAYDGQGLHLDSYYTWEIVPCVDGIGATLVCRERV